MHVRTCRCTPPQTCGKDLSIGSLVTHQIWTQSGQPLWSYRGRGCLRHPLPGTCHVPWQAPVGIGTGQIRNLLNGDIEQRRPLVNRSTRSRDISFSKASWGRVGSGWVGSGRVGSGRAYWDFCLKLQKNSLRASRSARNNTLCTTTHASRQYLVATSCHAWPCKWPSNGYSSQHVWPGNWSRATFEACHRRARISLASADRSATPERCKGRRVLWRAGENVHQPIATPAGR